MTAESATEASMAAPQPSREARGRCTDVSLGAGTSSLAVVTSSAPCFAAAGVESFQP